MAVRKKRAVRVTGRLFFMAQGEGLRPLCLVRCGVDIGAYLFFQDFQRQGAL